MQIGRDDPYVKDSYGRAAIDYALEAGNQDMVDLLEQARISRMEHLRDTWGARTATWGRSELYLN